MTKKKILLDICVGVDYLNVIGEQRGAYIEQGYVVTGTSAQMDA